MSRTPSLRPAARRAVVCGITLLMLVGGVSSARADLRFAQPAADAGEVRSGTPLVHAFGFTNPGPDPVEILEVQGSCGCLHPTAEPRTVPPGGEGKVRLEVHTLGQAAGPHTWRTRLRYRSGAAEYEMTLLLSARLVTEVTVQPASLTVFADGAVGHELLLTDLRPRPLGIAAVRATSPLLRPRVADEYRDGLGHLVRRIRLDVADDYPEGRHDEALDILTDDPAYQDLRVPVTVVKRARQRCTARPGAVTLKAVPGQAVLSRIVLLQDANDEAVEIERVTADEPALGCQWARGPNRQATIRVTVDAARLAGGELRGTIQVYICKPAAQVLTIPVTVAAP